MSAGAAGSAAAPGFGARLEAGFAAVGRLCVGIDPHAYLLADWGLPDDASGARELGLRVVDAAAGAALAVKPQLAFFERFGSAGYAALEEVIGRARAAGLLVIADAKRGDIGTSVEAYLRAWLEPGSPLESDAVTLSGFQGPETVLGPFEAFAAAGKGVFVLVAMSNPEAAPIQSARLAGGETVAASVLAALEARSAQLAGGRSLGPAGAVIGARPDLDAFGIDVAAAGRSAVPVLAPGFGHQGARVEDLGALLGRYAAGAIVTESRSILAAGPDGVAAAIRERNALLGRLAEARG